MKLICFIDSLGPGGAQRQLVTLAVGLKKRGHDVRFLVYHEEEHFLPLLQKAGILCQVIPPCSYGRRIFEVRRILRRGCQDVVLTFLEASCLYAELARMPRQGWGLVVGERLANPAMRSGVARWMRQGHRMADSVVTNTHTNRLMLHHQWPFLREKLTTIYNVVDLQNFCPTHDEGNVDHAAGKPVCRIVVGAGYHAKKNMIGLGKALLELRRGKRPLEVVVDWYGGIQVDPTPYNMAQTFIVDNGLTGVFNLHPPTRSFAKELANASVVGLFSFFEGLPNVICEGMACGRPILLSNVCDADSLVQEGKNGFLCDPASPTSIAESIRVIATKTEMERREMGRHSRRMAERLFTEESIVPRYERILEAAARHEPFPADCAWPQAVPASAVRTVDLWVNHENPAT